MLATAKIFSTGNSQAVRLPKAFRVDVSEMWIAKNEVTGEITLKPKDEDGRKARLGLLFKLISENPFTEDFIPERRNDPPRNPFEDCAEPLLEQSPITEKKRRKSLKTPASGLAK